MAWRPTAPGPGFTGAAAEKSGFVGDDMSGCVQSCIGFPTLMGLINAEDCSTTVDSISGANDDFKDVCENGFSQGGGGAGGAGGAAAGGNGGGGDNGN